MKRMKKKVVAMVTLAMFVLSMLPVAAFAAPTEDYTFEVNKTVTEVKATDVTVGVKVPAGTNYELWVEKDGAKAKTVEFSNVTQGAQKDGVYVVTASTGNDTVNVKFTAPGEYTVKGLYYEVQPGTGGTAKDPVAMKGDTVVTVKSVPVKDFAGSATIVAAKQNGVETTPLQITVNPVDVAKKANLEGAELTINNRYAAQGLKVLDKASQGKEISTIKLDNQGKATVQVVAGPNTPANKYALDLECNGVKGTVYVTVAPQTAVNPDKAVSITALPVEGVVSADASGVIDNVEFAVRNANGDLIDASNEAFAETNNSGKNAVDYVNVTAPKNCITDANVVLVQDPVTKNMQVKVKTPNNLVAGEYTVEFILLNGQKASTTFTLNLFDTVKEIKIVPDKKNGAVVMGNGTAATYTVKKVDANGVEAVVNVSDYNVAYKLPENTNVVVTTTTKGQLAVAPKAGAELKDILGAKVTVVVSYVANGKTMYATQEYTVVSPEELASKYELQAEYKDGKVLSDIPVTVKVADPKNPAKTQTITELVATVESQSNKAANVVVTMDGVQGFSVYSDKDTSVDIKIVAFANNGANSNVYYSKNITLNIGSVNEEVLGTLVGLTIGSKDMIVNNKVVKIDAAPFVNKDYRTMVPLSAITEAFGVTPEWNEKDRSVTVEMNGVKVVMTIDKQAYTVNGEKKTMDTAPVIVNSRTMVPVRFVAEELGFNVAPIMSDKGLTEGVVISK